MLSHAVLLVEVRSYLAALTDNAVTLDWVLEYERVLLALDELHAGVYTPTTVVRRPIPADDVGWCHSRWSKIRTLRFGRVT